MKPRIPLYAKVLLWLALNLALIVALFAFFPGRAGSGWDMLLTPAVRERLLVIGTEVGTSLSTTDPAQWRVALAPYESQYGVSIGVGTGPPHGGRPPPPRRPPPKRTDARPPPPPKGPPGPPPRGELAAMISVRHADFLDAYVVSIPSSLATAGDAPPRPIDLSVRAPDLPTFLRFLGVSEWIVFPALVIGLSIALWTPFVWSVTRALRRVTRSTERIAEGHFDTRVTIRRRDELGLLAGSVNRLAERLGDFVSRQKEFLADVAHEVTSPLARMRMGLGLLEPQLQGRTAQLLRGVQDDAQQMALLLDELLMFARADADLQQAGASALVAVDVRSVVDAVLAREDPQRRVQRTIAPDLAARAHPLLLERALANLVRNALRYAADAGPIELVARLNGERVSISVRDHGPGVSAEALRRLGEPFYRPEAARSRDSGGFGLGLAIVRRCVSACNGDVSFRNPDGGGFEATIELQAIDHHDN